MLTRAQHRITVVLSATVSIRTAICPECGTTYTAGGTTTTQIRYSDESNPYQQNKKSADAAALIGKIWI